MLTVCAGSAFAEPATVTGSAPGMESVITATITIDNGEITAVELDVSGETSGIGDITGDALAQQVLDAQGAEIDGVSGATVTSDAVRAAVRSALDAAAGNLGNGLLVPGTYTATAHGAKHDLTVEVDVSINQIVTPCNDIKRTQCYD